ADSPLPIRPWSYLVLLVSHGRNTGSFNQSHQLGHRGDIELLHNPAAVNFYCLLCRAQLSGNLLVQHAGNDELHYFELARCQQIEKTPGLILLSATPSLLGRSNQGVLDGLQQLVTAKRLSKKIDRARLHRLSAPTRHRRWQRPNFLDGSSEW